MRDTAPNVPGRLLAAIASRGSPYNWACGTTRLVSIPHNHQLILTSVDSLESRDG